MTFATHSPIVSFFFVCINRFSLFSSLTQLQADMHLIATYKASTSRHNATVQLVYAGALTSTASNLQILAQEANQIAVNTSKYIKKKNILNFSSMNILIFFYFISCGSIRWGNCQRSRINIRWWRRWIWWRWWWWQHRGQCR